MSTQFNYFAAGLDNTAIGETVLSSFPNAFLLPQRGTSEEMQGTRLTDVPALLAATDEAPSFTPYFIVPQDRLQDVVLHPVKERLFCVQLRESPVIEYSPSISMDANTVRIGRFMYAYSDDRDLSQKARRLFAQLKKQACLLPERRHLWIFPEAAHSALWLHPGLGKPWKNSLYGA